MTDVSDRVMQQAIIKELAEAVIIQAVRDLRSKRLEQQLSAALWLAGPDLPLWLAVAFNDDPEGLTDAGLLALTNGRLKKDKRLLK